MQIAQIISYWNNLDFDSRKYVIRVVHEDISDENLNRFSTMTYHEIEDNGYSKLIDHAVKNDIHKQQEYCK